MNISIGINKRKVMCLTYGFLPENSNFHKQADYPFTNSALCDSKDFFISQNLSKNHYHPSNGWFARGYKPLLLASV